MAEIFVDILKCCQVLVFFVLNQIHLRVTEDQGQTMVFVNSYNDNQKETVYANHMSFGLLGR